MPLRNSNLRIDFTAKNARNDEKNVVHKKRGAVNNPFPTISQQKYARRVASIVA
jgi:hypothetical protein